MSTNTFCEASPAGALPRELFGYEVIDVLGRGAGAVLYLACEPNTGQIYALKHSVRQTDKDIRFIDQMRTEYDVGTVIKHKNVRRSIEFKLSKSFTGRATEAALLLEIFDGKPLDEVTDVPVHKTVDYFAQVASALWALHERGFLHCDLKPGNILVNPEGEVKVIDLGQACRVGTIKERIQGTPDFIAPEQVRCERLTERTDTFNFGATFYWALTGRKLPTMMNIGDHSRSFIMDQTIPAPSQFNPLIPEHLSTLVMDCVKMNPQQRPAAMGELATRLETIAFGLRRRSEQRQKQVA